MLEQRIDQLDNQLLQDELVHLQRDSVTDKIDHPSGGSKDVADSHAGWVWNAIKHNPGIVVPTKKVVSAISAVNRNTNRQPGANLPSMFPGLNKPLNPFRNKFKR